MFFQTNKCLQNMNKTDDNGSVAIRCLSTFISPHLVEHKPMIHRSGGTGVLVFQRHYASRNTSNMHVRIEIARAAIKRSEKQ